MQVVDARPAEGTPANHFPRSPVYFLAGSDAARACGASSPPGRHAPGNASCTLLSQGTETGSFTYNNVEELVRKLILVLSFALPLLALSAFAQDWSKSYTVGAKPSLRADTNDAAIEITRGTSNTIAARVIAEGYKNGASDLHITEHQDGDKVDLTVRFPSDVGIHIGWNGRWNNHRARIEVQVPQETTLDLHPSYGHITVDGVVSEVYLSSGDGHIEFTAREGSKMARGWLLHTGDGRVEIKLPQDFAAELSAHTGDGRITLDFPGTVNGDIGPSRVRGKLNGGGELLEITTGDGSIHVGKL